MSVDKALADNIPNVIALYLNCRKCIEELPEGESPKSYARTQAGLTRDARFQVWCNRHEISVALLSFAEAKKIIFRGCQGRR